MPLPEPDDVDALYSNWDPVPAAPSTPEPALVTPGLDDVDLLYTNTTALDADSDTTRQHAINHDDLIDDADATGRAAATAPMYYAMPRFLRALDTADPAAREKMKTFRRRSENMIERIGGPLAYIVSRPMQYTTYRGLEEMHKRFPGGAQAFERLYETMPEPGREHTKDVPSMEQHEQLDDVVADSIEATSWLDTEPQIMERMSSDIDAEKLYVVSHYGGDWGAYEQDLESMPLYKRLGIQGQFLVEDVFAPDPMFLIDKPLRTLKAIGKGAKLIDEAIAAKKLGVSLADVRGALKTAEVVRGGDIGTLEKHIAGLENKLEGLNDGDQYQRVARRLVEAQAEYAARLEEAADPHMKLFRPKRRHPSSFYKPLHEMDETEVARRYGLAEERASIGEVDAAVKSQGYKDTQAFINEMDRAHNLLIAGDKTEVPGRIFQAFENLPDAVKSHLDALGVSRSKIMESAALTRGDVLDIARHANLENAEVAAARAFMGPDDVEEAGMGLAHMRDGGSASNLSLHAVQSPEHSVLQKVEGDGVWLRSVPDYRSKQVGGLRTLSRRDSLTYLLGRQSIPGLGIGSTHIDVSAVVKPLHKVGRKMAFGAAKFLPLSVSSFVPEVARILDKATANYKLDVTDGQRFLAGAFKSSGLFKETRDGTFKIAKGLHSQVDHVIDMLDTEVDALTGTSAELEALMKNAPQQLIDLHNSVRSWLNGHASRLDLPLGKAISGYFPHFFPEGNMRNGQRALEFSGVNPRAFVSFFALNKRTGAKGWSRNMVDVLDLYNRGASRKVMMEPAYNEISNLADAYRAAGKLDEANYTDKFLMDARGQGRSIFDFFADSMHMPQGVRNTVEVTTREATALVYKALLGGNLNYAIQNMAGGLTNMAADSGAFHLMQGLLRFSLPEWRKVTEKSGVLKEALHSLEQMPQNTSKAMNSAYNVMDVGQKTEHFLRGVSVNTALSKLVSNSGKSWKEIRAAGAEAAYIKEAARITDRTQHIFGPLGRSPYLHTLLGHTGYQATVQLGTYPWKQAESLLKSMKGDPGFIVKYLAYSGIMARMAAQADIAAGPSVGFGFIESVINPRHGRVIPYSPLFEGFASTVDMWQAMRSGDPSDTKLAVEKWQSNMEAMTFAWNQFERYARNTRESLAGRKEKFQDREPMSVVVDQLRTGTPEIYSKERDLEPDERLLHALGIQTVQDRIEMGERKFKKGERQAEEKKKLEREQKRETAKRRRRDAKRQREVELRGYEDSLDAYEEALRRGDAATASAIYEKGRQAGRMSFSDDQSQAAREAAFLRARLKMLRRAPGFLPPSMSNRGQ